MTVDRTMQSAYMHWAKANRSAQFNLAVSDVVRLSLRDLEVSLDDLELSGQSLYGYEPLQKALAAKCQVPEECVVAATGTSMANHLVLAAMLQPGDEVLIETPTYEPLLAVAQYLGARVRRFERRFEDQFRVDPDEVQRNVGPQTRLIVITNLNNPTGIQTDIETLKRIGEIARESDARVLVDEVYLETLFEQAPFHSAFRLGMDFISTSSLTKAYGLSGLRCGWILADADLAKKIWRLNDLFGAVPAHAAERLSVVSLQQLDQIAARAKNLLQTNRVPVEQFFEQQDQLEVVMPPAGTICFPRLKQGHCDTFCAELANAYDTRVVPGSCFGMPDHFRLGFGCDTETLIEGLRRINEALQNQQA